MDLENVNHHTNAAYGPVPGMPPVVEGPDWTPELREHALREVQGLEREPATEPGFLAHLWRLMEGGTPLRVVLHLSPAVARDMGLPEQVAYDRYMDAFRGGYI